MLLTVFLSGCVPLNINVNQSLHVKEEPKAGIYCEGGEALKLLEYQLPDLVNVDDAKNGKEAVDRLIDHIDQLRKEQLELITTLQQSCKSVRRI